MQAVHFFCINQQEKTFIILPNYRENTDIENMRGKPQKSSSANGQAIKENLFEDYKKSSDGH